MRPPLGPNVISSLHKYLNPCHQMFFLDSKYVKIAFTVWALLRKLTALPQIPWLKRGRFATGKETRRTGLEGRRCVANGRDGVEIGIVADGGAKWKGARGEKEQRKGTGWESYDLFQVSGFAPDQ